MHLHATCFLFVYLKLYVMHILFFQILCRICSNCSSYRLLLSCIRPIPILKEEVALVQVEGLYPTLRTLKYTSSDVGGLEDHPLLLVCLTPPALYPPYWTTYCWFCCTAVDWNILLCIYVIWCWMFDVWGCCHWVEGFCMVFLRLPKFFFFFSVARKGTLSQPVYARNIGRTYD